MVLGLCLKALCAVRGELLDSRRFWSVGLVLFEPLAPARPREVLPAVDRGWVQRRGVRWCRDRYPSQEMQSVLSSKPGFLLRKREELKSVQLLLPTPLFSQGYFLRPYISLWGNKRLGWGALVSWQHCPLRLDLAVGCGVPSTPSGSVRTASSLVSHLSSPSAGL